MLRKTPPSTNLFGHEWLVRGLLAIFSMGGITVGQPIEARPKQQAIITPSDNHQVLQHAADLHERGMELFQQGRYEEARPLLQNALKIRQETLSVNHPDVALSLDRLATLYREQGRYREAEPLYQAALEILRETLGATHPQVANSLVGLAALHRIQGRYREAESLCLEALEIYRTTSEVDDSNVATNLYGLAANYRLQGRYDEAEPLLLEALAIYRNTLGTTDPYVAISLNLLALLYGDQGRYGEAEPLLLEALEIYKETLGNTHPEVATSLNNLALLYRNQRRYFEAEPLFQQALAINQATLGDTHPKVALNLNNLALLYSERDRYSEAEPLFLEALAIYRETVADTHPYVAPNLNNLALLYWKQGRPDEAEPLLQQTLEIIQETLGNTHPKVALTLNNLALMQQAKGDIENAIASFQRSLQIQEQNLDLNLANLSETARQDYIATILRSTYQAISFHLHGGPKTSAADRLALNTILRRKGRLLDTSVDGLERLRQNLTPADQAVLDQLIETRRELSALIFNPSNSISPNQYKTQLNQLELASNSLGSKLARRSARFRVESEPVDIAKVQHQIPTNGVLVEYMRYRPFNVDRSQSSWREDDHYVAYLLFPNGRIEVVDLGRATPIDAAIRDFRQALQGRPPRFYTYNEQPGSHLKSLIFAPISPYLGDTEHLLISPDGQLNQIPFEALKMAGEDDYLIQQYQISYLNSGRDLLKFDIVSPSQEPAVILANPDYDAADTLATQAATRSARSSDMAQLQFGALPGTAAEAEAIAPIFPEATVLTGTQATENVLKAVNKPRILHIATHGFFFSDGDSTAAVVENPLLRSGLILAGFNHRESGPEDGVLTALEATNLNLEGTQLVVLSACDTGLGDIANGEGVYGLRRSFAIAGAESQLISLWQVSDQGTQVLMAGYYKKLQQGMGRSKALRTVQLELLEDAQYNVPFYWASFILAGNWQPLE